MKVFAMARAAKAYIMYGLGGPMFSSGMKTLAERLRSIGMIVPEVYGWDDWRVILADINKLSASAAVMVCGHSMGGNAATWIAGGTKRKIDLLVSYDPTIWSTVTPLGENVERAVNYRGTNWFNIVGHANLSRTGEFAGSLTTIPTSTTHTSIDDDTKLHDYTVTTARKLLV